MAQLENKQSQELANKLWAIANDLRGSMDSSKFKDYILGVIFYRYLSEHTENYINNELLKDDGLTYEEALQDEELAEAVKEWSLEHLGYIMEPKNLFRNLIAKINANDFTIEDFEIAIREVIGSTIGQDSEAAFDKLFDDMNLQDKDLGKEVSDRTDKIKKVMLRIHDIEFNLADSEIDILGTAYMYLIGMFASDAGKKAGEFFTTACVSDLVARIATVGLTEVRSACDPCAGSGSMLLELKNHLSTGKVGHFYAQEMNGSTYNLLRMNLLMHGVPYRQFSAFNDDTIKKDNFEEEQFQVQVSNPPYSAHLNVTHQVMENDPRFSAAGAMPPKAKADLGFVEHMVYHMAEDGRIAVLLPHGVLFRGGAEETIRKYFIENLNCLDAVIGLPAKLFMTTSIPVALLVFKKNRNGDSDNIYFVDASKEFKANKKMNTLEEEHIQRIVEAYTSRQDIEKFARKVSLSEIEENGYNLNISHYVDTSEEEPEIDLVKEFAILKELEKEEQVLNETLRGFFAELGLEGLY
ncbi:MAG: type I restriction-modification system subunit M [Peptococcaceae bacterium]|nr:type I restriction-modification system subunit M [Peptococcaceae bacterium]